MSQSLPEPGDVADVSALILQYLDFYRSEVIRKVEGLDEDVARTRAEPFGWSPLEMLNHLAHVERRWFVWGFLAEPTEQPWGDRGPDDRWTVPPGAGAEQLAATLLAGGRRTRAVVGAAALDERARVGGRFPSDGPEPPRLLGILLHVLQ